MLGRAYIGGMNGCLCQGCNACVAAGKLEEAESLVGKMRQKGFRPDVRVYNIVLKASVHC